MLHLITGGVRSGKSRFVLEEAEKLPGHIAFIATAQAFDTEMAERIARHRQERGPRYQTIEEPFQLSQAIEASRSLPICIVDCLTVWAGNHFHADLPLEDSTHRLLELLSTPHPQTLFLVTNEVGMGIVPDNAMARAYRDALGRLNQRIASIADQVTMVVCGLSIRIK